MCAGIFATLIARLNLDQNTQISKVIPGLKLKPQRHCYRHPILLNIKAAVTPGKALGHDA